MKTLMTVMALVFALAGCASSKPSGYASYGATQPCPDSDMGYGSPVMAGDCTKSGRE